jgi:hypothetical protein
MLQHVLQILCLLIAVSYSDGGRSEIGHSAIHEKASSIGNCSFVPQGGGAAMTQSHPCEVVKILLVGSSIQTGVSYLQDVADGLLVHKLLIEAVDMEPHEFGLLVDHFLVAAPWWVINKEMYSHHTIEGNVKQQVHLIVLHRYLVRYEADLRRLAMRQYPPSQEVCDTTPLHIGRMINSGWGSQMLFATFENNYQYAVFNVWYSVNNTVGESMQTCHADDCGLYPGTINKWECVFLPLTNCSMDKMQFTKCHFYDYKPGWGRVCFPYDFAVFNNMSPNGAIDTTNTAGKAPANDYQRLMDDYYPPHAPAQILCSKFIVANGDVLTTKSVAVRAMFVLFGLIFRPNYNLRSRVLTTLAELEEHKHIPFPLGKTECVAVHIRRGDRTRNLTIPITEYCGYYKSAGLAQGKCTPFDLAVANSRLPKELNLPIVGDCQQLTDIGCFHYHPFGSLSLVDYLERASLVVPSAHAAFVMTDDGPWLEQQLAELPSSKSAVSNWQVGYLPARERSRLDQNGTRYTTDFWASIAAARQCAGFVGHFGSGVSQFVFEAMCFQHGSHTGICPPTSDIGL